MTSVFSNTIRKIVIATADVTTLAGTENEKGNIDGVGAVARFDEPNGITTDGIHLFVADTNNHTIRKIVIATGAVTTLAGVAEESGSVDGLGTAAKFYAPKGITTDGTNLYVADSANRTIRKIVIATGVVTTLAGMAGEFGAVDGKGGAARFRFPRDITTDGINLYVVDENAIRKIVIATGVVSTQLVKKDYFYDSHKGITTDGANLYVGHGSTVLKIVIATGEVSIVAGYKTRFGYSDGKGAEASFYDATGITTDGTNLYVVDTPNFRIRKIVIATGEVTTLAGSDVRGFNDGLGGAAAFRFPVGITTNGTELYVTDSMNNNIRKID